MSDITCAQRIVAGARGCLGVPFRPQGRNPAIGLDCIGLAGVALGAAGARVALPGGYALRGGTIERIASGMAAAGLVAIAPGDAAPGDLVLAEAGLRQWHLCVLADDGFIHADAGLRRVVETPGAPPWPICGAWRWRPAIMTAGD